MLKRLTYICYVMAMCLLVAGCGEEVYSPAEPIPGDPGTLTVRFRNSELTRSVASDNSERRIQNLTIAFYPTNADGTVDENVAAVEIKTFQNPTGNTTHDAIVTLYLTDQMIRDLFTGSTQCCFFAVANLPSEKVPTTKATIADLKAIAVTSDFYNTQVQPSFVMSGTGSVTYTAPASGATVGSASGNGILYRAAAKINLNIKLPASITVNGETWHPVTGAGNLIVYVNNGVSSAVTYPGSPDPAEDEEPWKPTDSDAYYNSNPTVQATYRTLVDNGTVTENESIQDPETGAITTTPVTLNQFKTDIPFYTYPNAWSGEDFRDINQTTLTLIVRWYRNNASQWTNYYYQVPVTPNDIYRIVRNNSYSINLKVGMLGSLVPDTPLTVEDCTYQVVNWNTENVDVQIKDYRYLVVNPNMISVQNESEILVPFFSSHPVDIDDVSMTFQRFNYYSNGNGDVVDIVVDKNIIDRSTWTHTEGGTQVTDSIISYSIVRDPTTNQLSLKIKHALDIWNPYNGNTEVALTGHDGSGTATIQASDLGITTFHRPDDPDPAYSAYTINVKIRHKDNPAYNEDLTLTQYPGLYIEPERNNGGTYNTGYTGGGPGGGRFTTTNFGNVFVNPTKTNAPSNYSSTYYYTNDSDLGGLNEITASTNNQNPNMYVINITQLNNTLTKDYIIGEARSKTINNLNDTGNATNAAGTWCQTAPALVMPTGSTATTRRLTFYYPTEEGDEYKMYIAPKFRVASSYAKMLKSVDKANCRRRAATYQEQGYPAGRWRLPTYGELKFIVWLSGSGKIPHLFNSGGTYMTAQGPYVVGEDGSLTESDATTAYTRPVYDDWYWENYPQYTITPGVYTLGDMPRTTEN